MWFNEAQTLKVQVIPLSLPFNKLRHKFGIEQMGARDYTTIQNCKCTQTLVKYMSVRRLN